MYKLVVFDFDGTIANTDEIRYKAYSRLAEKHGLREITDEEAKRLQTMPTKEQMKYMEIPAYKIPGILRDALEIYGEFVESASLYPGIMNLLEDLKKAGIDTAILSSNSDKNIKKFLDAHRVDYFSDISGKASLFGKHRALKRLLNKLEMEKDEIIYIGDEVRDINSCKKIGVTIAAVSWGYDSRQVLEAAEPDYLADTSADLKKIILES